MNSTNSAQDLGQRIEQMIKQHIATSQACAQQAVARAFTSAASGSTPVVTPRRARSSPGRKRPSADIAALGEQFHQAVCAKPGEIMTVLSVDVGATARELSRPVTLLRRAGRIRAVGSRHLTRYFPLSAS